MLEFHEQPAVHIPQLDSEHVGDRGDRGTSRNDGEDESEDSDNDIMELDIDNTMNEVFGELF